MRPHIPSHFTPHRFDTPAEARGWWTCASFLGQFYAEREPGADDE